MGDDEHTKPLTDEEIMQLRRDVLRVFRTLDSIGSAGRWLKNILVWCAVMIGVYYTFNEWLVKFIHKAAGQ